VRDVTENLVHIDRKVLTAIAASASEAYPYEGCGALLGTASESAGRRVTVTLAIPNREWGTPRVRFEISPRDYLAVEDEADRLGLALLGFWHSHPDHPALPSKTDRAYAWQGLLTVIVSVPAGKSREINAWEILGPEASFTPLPIVESDRGTAVDHLLAHAAA
jgi:proteasome lid subunit RPN8/RPN11